MKRKGVGMMYDGTSVHRQRSKVTLGCLPGPTHLRIKWCNCPCRASATPEPGDEEKRGGDGARGADMGNTTEADCVKYRLLLDLKKLTNSIEK